MLADIASLAAQLTADRPSDRAEAAEKLARLGNDARAAAVALVHAVGDESAAVREWATAALEDLGPPPGDSVAKLCDLTASDRPDVAYWAVTLLGRLGADAASAVAPLAKALAAHPEIAVRERAAWAFAQIGPAANSATRALQAAASGGDERLARLARQALERISPA